MLRQDGSSTRARKRDACDRCHEMKSRCNKPSGSSSCTRCERSGWHCHFSDALRAGRPKKRVTEPSQQESTSSEMEVSINTESNSSLEARSEFSSTVLDSMLDFASPLPDLFPGEQTIDNQLQLTGSSDMILESWLSVERNDTQSDQSGDHGTSIFTNVFLNNPAENSISNPPRTDSGFASSTSSDTHSTSGFNIQTCTSRPINCVVQRLLELHSTLQRISKAYADSENCSSEDSWTAQTAMEETFLATDKLVSVIEDLNLQATPDVPQPAVNLYRGNTRGDMERSHKRSPGYDSTSLLVLSCYACVLEVYQVQVESMCDQAEDVCCDVGSARGHQRTDSSTTISSFTSSLKNIPVLNIGQFNLRTSPVRNISLLLHVTQDMVERLQGAMQFWASLNNKTDAYSPTSTRSEFYARSTRSVLRTRRRDSTYERNQDDGAQRAMPTMFDSVLSGVESRERQLKVSIQEVKDLLKDTF